MRARSAQEIFEDLYERHAADVYRYALAVLRNPTDAEDVTQTTFLNAYRAIARGEEPRLPQHWLIKIAHNACRTRAIRAARRPREIPLDDSVRELAAVEPEQSGLEEVLNALGRLPFNQRAALVMRELEGRSYEEIAETLDVSIGAVETLIFRARRSLRLRRDSLRGLLGLPLPVSLEPFAAGTVSTGGMALSGGIAAKLAALVAALVAGGASVVVIQKTTDPSGTAGRPQVAAAANVSSPAGSAVRLAAGSLRGGRAAAPRVRSSGSPVNGPASSPAPGGVDPATPGGGNPPATPAVTPTPGTPGVAVPTTPVPGVTGATPATPRLPAVPTPTTMLPGVSAPVVTMPGARVPGVTVPGPTVPGVTVPGATAPGATVPGATVPSATVPGVTTPTVTVGGTTLPSVTTPSVTAPVVTTPSVTVPTVSVPRATVPTVTTPGVTTPSVSVPTVTIPSVSVPTVTLP